MTEITRIFNVPYVIIKRLFQFIDAFAVLFLINLGSKAVQGLFLFKKAGFESFVYMFTFSLIFHLFLIVIYDIVKKDFFEFERIKKNKEKRCRKSNSLIPWTQKMSKYVNEIHIVKKIKGFYNGIALFKKMENVLIFVILNASDPMIVVIYYRPGNHRWNFIPNFRIFSFFVLSCLICTLTLFLFFSGIKFFI